eukprot:1084806-Amphidinium_carterae.1
MARAQGKTDWYRDIRSNDLKLQEALREYSKVQGTQGARKRLSRSVVLQALEEVICSTSFHIEEVGQMCSASSISLGLRARRGIQKENVLMIRWRISSFHIARNRSST